MLPSRTEELFNECRSLLKYKACVKVLGAQLICPKKNVSTTNGLPVHSRIVPDSRVECETDAWGLLLCPNEGALDSHLDVEL